MLSLWQQFCILIGIVGAFYWVIMAVFAAVRASRGETERANDLITEARNARLGSIGMTFFTVTTMIGLLLTLGPASVLVAGCLYGLWRLLAWYKASI